jgi:hypothetical protein
LPHADPAVLDAEARAIGAREAAWLLAHAVFDELGPEPLKRLLTERAEKLEVWISNPAKAGTDPQQDAFGRSALSAELTILSEIFAKVHS